MSRKCNYESEEVETEGAVLTVAASRIDFLVINLQVVDGIGDII